MQNTKRALGFHYLIRSIIVLSFSILITYLVKTGYIHLYIAPRMLILIKLSAICLYVIGAYQLYTAYLHIRNKPSENCDCEHAPSGSVGKHVMIYGIFVFPLLLSFLLPNTTMGTALASKKGMNLSASTIRASEARPQAKLDQQQYSELEPTADTQLNIDTDSDSDSSSKANNLTDEQLDALFVTDIYNEDFARLAKQIYRDDVIVVEDELYMEILTAVDLFLDSFSGRTVEISGFVYRESDMSHNQFVVGRFAVDCCSADAVPYGVLIEHTSAPQYENDAWVKVRGQIDTTVYNGNEIMVFKPESIQSIEAPDMPYVYPNYDF